MSTCLIVVDVENDFINGSLPVEGGAEVAADITRWIAQKGDHYDLIVATRDWHVDPGGHFATNIDQEPDYFETWPVHCVAGTYGAEFHENLKLPTNTVMIYKGMDKAAYSGFEGWTDELVPMTLDALLKLERIDAVDVVGIATDFCVKATALDARKLGYYTQVLTNLCAAVNEDTVDSTYDEFLDAGITLGWAKLEESTV